MAGFRKVYMRAFCYSIRNMNYKQMRADALGYVWMYEDIFQI